MATEVVIVGAGGFGREALDVARALGHTGEGPLEILGVVDDRPSEANLARLQDQGVRLLGDIESLLALPHARFAIGIGNPAIRSAVACRLERSGLRPISLVHPTAVIGSRSPVADGAIICAGAQISTNVRIGRHAHINPHATIGHDTTIGDFVSVNPGAVVSGDVHVGDRTLVGAGAVILQGLTIGAGSVIGAAACVVHDVGDAQTVKGVPAR